MKRKTGFFFDERCFWHSTGLHAVTLPVGGWVQPPAGGGHAESPETKRRMKNLMDVSGLTPQLALRSAAVELKSLPPEEGENLGHLDLLVHMGDEQNFIYKIWPQQYSVPGFTYRARSGKSTYYRLETFLLEGSQGNDLMDYSKEQVITDILDQYERHLNFIHLHREAPGNSVMFPDG